MKTVVGIYAPGVQSFKDENTGKWVDYDTVIMSYISDEIPENLVGVYHGVRAFEKRMSGLKVKLVGADNWNDILGCEIVIDKVENLKGKEEINRVIVVGAPAENKANETKKS